MEEARPRRRRRGPPAERVKRGKIATQVERSPKEAIKGKPPQTPELLLTQPREGEHQKKTSLTKIMATCECLKPELDLFSNPPTQTSVKEGYHIEYHPFTALKKLGPIKFVIDGTGDEYLDLYHTYLYVEAKVVCADGSPLPDDTDEAPVNLTLHSLFSQVDQVEPSGDLIKSYLPLPCLPGNIVVLWAGSQSHPIIM